MTDSPVTAALRECEEAVREYGKTSQDFEVRRKPFDILVISLGAAMAAIARYGDLREKAGGEKERGKQRRRFQAGPIR